MRRWIVLLTACAAGKDPAPTVVSNRAPAAEQRDTTQVSWILGAGLDPETWGVRLELTDADGWTRTVNAGPARGAVDPRHQQRCGARPYEGDLATLTFVDKGMSGFALLRQDDGTVALYRWTLDGAECSNTHGRSCPRLMSLVDTVPARDVVPGWIEQEYPNGAHGAFSCGHTWARPATD